MPYEKLDNELITNFLFHPREGNIPSVQGEDIAIDVGDCRLGARFFKAGKENPTILFFHGNGEIVSDYNDIGELYIKQGINFFIVDYRGYGTSTGNPTASVTISDSKLVFEFVKKYLKENQFSGDFYIMGRSLGSASALEIADNFKDDFKGLIIESGFAYTVPLLNILGIRIEMDESEGFNNLEKAKKYSGPLLVIHAENDHIIPFSDGEELYKNSLSEVKELVMIETADHNTIFYYGIDRYIEAVKRFVK